MKNLAAVVLVGMAALVVQAPDQETVRLRQELDSLKFRFDYETDRLERRVESLEREAARRPTGAPLPTPTPAPLIVPAPNADEITVRRLVVTDDEGRVRGVLAVSEIYGPMLGLLDEFGDVMGLFAAGADGARLEIYDGSAASRLELGLLDGEAAIRLHDAAGEVTARIPTSGGVPR